MLEVLPGIGLDRARFGESRSSHRERLGSYKAFERVPGSGVTDIYEDGMVMLSYDESDRLVFIEIGGETAVLLGGIQLTGRPLGAVLDELAQGDIPVEFDGDSSYAISSTGVELFTSSPDDINEPVGGVSVILAGRQ
ncbi:MULTISPECIES: hypothetical protein [unclassified Micromonospora]|uniref:hypothetical protein n=1 Tax=unclassified Micromonospora TaxID=2617518 RepID=UPI00188ED0E3|nr:MULTISPECIES: hypothetical protein [unclassified Micromonospora]MBF5029422.1 hypothetical protein [Micromonospora sp. ANENR4]MCZ7473579.1 hypothetical protein [Micromonospora sp. WMMC273]WBC04232.1 hypothetical protein O7546_04450 [Micromonospora sp. WMMA1976]